MIPANEQYVNGHALILAYARLHGPRSAAQYALLIARDVNACDARKAGALDASLTLALSLRSNGRSI